MIYSLARTGLVALASMLIFTSMSAHGQGPEGHGYLDILDENLVEGANWSVDPNGRKELREGGFNSSTYLYMTGQDSPISIRGLNIPIRENPGPGEFRFLSFAWRKWGSGPIAIKFELSNPENQEGSLGAKDDYTLYAGERPPKKGKGLQLTDQLGGGWQDMPLDLWQTFGEFTVTGLTFIVESRDAGFDAVAFAATLDGFSSSAPLVQPKIADSVETGESAPSSNSEAVREDGTTDEVKIDWAGQIKAGGIWMYPLYVCAIAAMVISVQRLLTIRESRLAPPALCQALGHGAAKGNFESVIKACDANPSTLANVVRFILEHPHAGIDVVNQTAGDIASRDIRGHLARIYPLSLISSISPLLGLLGTIIGMVEAFGIVALYGDEGGASILSDSISKALITTAAGLIVAIPCIAVYFTLKNRIMTFATLIEVEVEQLITHLYLRPGSNAGSGVMANETHLGNS
ncbi:biopolymer transport protein ExbB [Haloferula luteola]|uniref:Biopolymer transport protein ExbB n=1 Tax=Haloferula luteola TaxID=595692 RepID=A0A840UUL2_9BACT|nr:MotA/TolQ/ExbB proton channel family protein [Haloferula luteola]MBB5349887.1 biopolymer transport protein ExbB [Haloferula luteola]